MQASALSVRRMGMTFPGTRALFNVDLDVAPGEVHALIGHNGSGKSTMVKILSGLYTPDPGSEVLVDGQSLPWQAPAESERLGLRVVHQNLGLIGTMTVTENVALGAGYQTEFGRPIAWRRENKLVGETMARLGYDVNPRTPVGQLPAATRSAVAVARALMRREGRSAPQVVLLDEVTATMPDAEISRLLDLVRTLKSQGIAVLYVSHHLEEVLEACDKVTVLRDGECVISRPVEGLSQVELADLIVGGTDWREKTTVPVAAVSDSNEMNELRLQVTDLTGPSVAGVSFDAGPGRVIGVAGITGSGREEIAKLLLGGIYRGGTVTLGGKALPPGDPHTAVRRGMVLVPAERLVSAVVPSQNVRENLTLSGLHRTKLLSRLNFKAERQDVRSWISRLTIRGAAVEGSINTLSGGNQQKVILARCLNVNPKVLLLDEPTQGVDIGAVAEIHALIKESAAHSAVVVCSSDSYELASLCSEVLVMHRGRVIGRLHGEDITEHNLDRLQLSAHTSTDTQKTTENVGEL